MATGRTSSRLPAPSRQRSRTSRSSLKVFTSRSTRTATWRGCWTTGAWRWSPCSSPPSPTSSWWTATSPSFSSSSTNTQISLTCKWNRWLGYPMVTLSRHLCGCVILNRKSSTNKTWRLLHSKMEKKSVWRKISKMRTSRWHILLLKLTRKRRRRTRRIRVLRRLMIRRFAWSVRTSLMLLLSESWRHAKLRSTFSWWKTALSKSPSSCLSQLWSNRGLSLSLKESIWREMIRIVQSISICHENVKSYRKRWWIKDYWYF